MKAQVLGILPVLGLWRAGSCTRSTLEGVSCPREDMGAAHPELALSGDFSEQKSPGSWRGRTPLQAWSQGQGPVSQQHVELRTWAG